MAGINVIYGAGSAGSWGNEVEGPQVLDVLEELGVSKIDTARIYGPSEQLLGERGAAARIALDTKHPGGFARETRATKENILEVAKTSFELLKTDQVILPPFFLSNNTHAIHQLLMNPCLSFRWMSITSTRRTARPH